MVVFEEVVAYQRKVRVGREREEDARLVEHELAVGVRRDRSELQRDEPAVLPVERLQEPALSANKDG